MCLFSTYLPSGTQLDMFKNALSVDAIILSSEMIVHQHKRSKHSDFKGIVHPKKNILSSFTLK